MLIYIFCVLFSLSAFPQVKIHDIQIQSKEFEATEECGLKNFTVLTYDKEAKNLFGSKNIHRYSLMVTSWETTEPHCSHQFGIVQYIRGCVFNESRTQGGRKRYFGTTVQMRGKSQIFKFPTWEIDSVDIDPLYNSFNEDLPRLSLYRYAKEPFELNADRTNLEQLENIFFNQKNYQFLMNSLIHKSQIFTTDIPSGSYYDNVQGDLQVSSLEFKTCLYHLSDIPLQGSLAGPERGVEEGGPIHCFDWSDKTSFNSKTTTFSRRKVIHSFCQ